MDQGIKYRITRKRGICQLLTCCRGSEIDCMYCKEGITYEETNLYTQEEYLKLLKQGDVFITKVEIV